MNKYILSGVHYPVQPASSSSSLTHYIVYKETNTHTQHKKPLGPLRHTTVLCLSPFHPLCGPMIVILGMSVCVCVCVC